MVAVIFDGEATFPNDIDDLDSYCEWAASPDFPQRGRFSFIRGKVWMDLDRYASIVAEGFRSAQGRTRPREAR